MLLTQGRETASTAVLGEAGVYKLALLSLVYRGGVGNGCCRYLLVRCRPQLFAKEVPQAPAQCYLAHLLVPLVDVDWSTLVGDTLFLVLLTCVWGGGIVLRSISIVVLGRCLGLIQDL